MSDKGSLFLIVFALVVSGFTLYVRQKNDKDYKELIEKIGKRQTLEAYDYSRPFYVLCTLCTVFGYLSGVYGFLAGDIPTGCIGLVIGSMFCADFFTLKQRYCFYYNHKGFVGNSKNGSEYVEYRSIKGINGDENSKLVWPRVVTYNGKEFKVSPKCCKIINEQKNQRKQLKAR